MACFMCKGTVRDGCSAFTAELGNSIVVIKNVPSRVCGQCGEVSYCDEVAQRLEQIVQAVVHSAAAEVAVVSYSEKAA
jgi:YgiT-type zinc finger domain-containing protein